MSNKKLLIAIVMVVVMVFVAFGVMTFSEHSNSRAASTPRLETEILVPDRIVLIRGISPPYRNEITDYTSLLAKGIKEMSEKYQIINITPIIKETGAGSATSALILFVESKK